MNKFIKSGSRLLSVMVCFFVLTMFVDQANILDIVIGNNQNIDIEHPEEVDLSLLQSKPSANHQSFKRNVISSKTDFGKTKTKKKNSKRIIIDEDSPLTEAVGIKISTLAESFQGENTEPYHFISIQESIYLQNRSLLI